MDIRLTMPDLATTGSAVRVLRWLVKPGDSVARGQAILEIETDKAMMEVESTATGTVADLVLKEGDEVEAGALMATVRSADGPAPGPALDSGPGSGTAAAAAPAARDVGSAAAAPRRSMFERNARASAAAAPPLTAAGRVAAQRLALSKQTIPHFYLTMIANAEPMLARRRTMAGKPVWDAFFAKAIAESLIHYDRFACRFEENALVRQASVAVGVAADIDGDLHVLRVDRPGEKSVEQISAELRSGSERIRSDEPGAKRPQPGTITISNLGSTGVESFCAIINPPEAAILAIGSIAPRPYVVKDQVVMRHCVSLTLSVDHRVASGKYAANFLADVVRRIESL